MKGKNIIGLILIALGAGIALDQAGLFDFSGWFSTWWPLIPITIGVIQLLTRSAPVFWAIVFVAVGVVLQAQRLVGLDINMWRLFWPALMIVIGVSLLSRKLSDNRVRQTSDDRISSLNVFGGTSIVSESTQFEGGDINALFGGAELDLRRAVMSPNGATLDVFVAFGGATILVPRGWRVVATGLPIFGGWEDKTHHPSEADAPVLRVRAMVAFGGLEIKNITAELGMA
jgi:predicted membrane protein